VHACAPTLGVVQLTIPRLLHILCELAQPRKAPAIGKSGRVLDIDCPEPITLLNEAAIALKDDCLGSCLEDH
jgi:hypothetical protein